MLGDASNGSWKLAPAAAVQSSTRNYRGDALVLETTHRTAGGTVRVIDFMVAVREPGPRIVRLVEGVQGRVAMTMRLAARFGYGDLPPWTRRIGDAMTMTAVGDALALRSDVALTVENHDPIASFAVAAGERRRFELAWYPSHHDVPAAVDPETALEDTQRWWDAWSKQIRYDGRYAREVRRSLVLLKALMYAPSGAGVAAVTTSLPEVIGGTKNWDYRYAWVRDCAFTTSALLLGGLRDEARNWRDWVLCALAGRPQNLQIMYGVGGARRIEEFTLDHLPGYEDSRPVRIGNAAYKQFQLGVYGDTMSSIALAHADGIAIDEAAWQMIEGLLAHVMAVWHQPDHGIWESRGAAQHYTHSKVMAWKAFDAALQAGASLGYGSPRDAWRETRDAIHADVCANAFDSRRNTFVQSYGSQALDASVLILPIVGFLPPGDPRIAGTVAALERELVRDGFVFRTTSDPETAAQHAQPEGAFLACNFWLVECYALMGRLDDARALFERVIGIANDVGMLAEEYDPRRGRQVGNVPQTLSHATLVNAAIRLGAAAGGQTVSAT